MTEVLAQELAQLQPTRDNIAHAAKQCLSLVESQGGNHAATALAKAILDTTELLITQGGNNADNEKRMTAQLGVLDVVLRDATDVGTEVKDQLLAHNYLPTCFAKLVSAAPSPDTTTPLMKQGLQFVKGWKTNGVLPAEVCANLTNVLKRKVSAAAAGSGGADDAVGQPVETKVQTRGEVEGHTTTLSSLTSGIQLLPAARKDHYLGRLERYKTERGATGRFKRDEATLRFLAEMGVEVEAEVARTQTTLGTGADPSSPGHVRGPENFEQFLHERRGDQPGGSSEGYLPPQAGAVASYGTTRTLATSLLECDRGKVETLKVGTLEAGSSRTKYPWTVRERSPYVIRGASTSTYTLQWGPSAIVWASTKRLDEYVGVVENVGRSTASNGAAELVDATESERGKRPRDV